jgi:hypothetical protein
MIPLWMSIAVCGERRKFFRLWPFALLALPLLTLVWLLFGRSAVAKPFALWQVFSSMRGTLIDIDHPDGSVFIKIV